METLESARSAYEAHDWGAAHRLLSDLDAQGDLEEADLVALAEASWWVGDLDRCIAARERLYDIYTARKETANAAFEALALSLRLGDKGEEALASGWRARAYRLAEEEPNSRASGYLLSLEADVAFHAGASEECVAKARAARLIGETSGDETLVAWCTHIEGLGLLQSGQVTEAWARLDESMVGVPSGKLDPIWAGLMHCGMLLACELHEDWRRGRQWVENTERWLKDFPGAVLYPGVCRIHKVHFLTLSGVWEEAEREALRACEELLKVHVYTAGRGYYEIAEIKRLRGDYEAAEELYAKAHGLGYDPQPGLARLRLAQGRVDAASAGIRRVLDSAHTDPIIARLLPHKVEIALAGGKLDEARAASDRLTRIAETYRSPGLSAAAATCRGEVALAENDAAAAIAALETAIESWLQIDCPYELARARVLKAAAYRLVDDQDGVALELNAARAAFERLGATPDVSRVDELLGKGTHPAGLSEREVEVLKLVARGCSNKQIAAGLFISENTVARHISNIFTKLDVTSRAAAATYAHTHGLAGGPGNKN